MDTYSVTIRTDGSPLTAITLDGDVRIGIYATWANIAVGSHRVSVQDGAGPIANETIDVVDRDIDHFIRLFR